MWCGGANLVESLYRLDQVPGMLEHPDFWPGRDYSRRPNLISTLAGKGGGRSLLLTGHCDTVALGENVWSHPPFGGEIHAGKLYGLGASDMKGQLAVMLVLYKAIAEQGLALRGTLAFESVVDEEEGGVNGTLAGRLRGGPMDAAILPEASGLDLYPAVPGALIVNLTFSAEGTWLEVGKTGQRQADGHHNHSATDAGRSQQHSLGRHSTRCSNQQQDGPDENEVQRCRFEQCQEPIHGASLSRRSRFERDARVYRERHAASVTHGCVTKTTSPARCLSPAGLRVTVEGV